MSLKRSLIWTALDVGVSAALSFIFRLVVARILSPDQFGIAALALAVIGVVQVFSDFGFSAALIQRKSDQFGERVVRTTFTISVMVCLVLAILTGAVVAPVLGSVVGEPAVAEMVVVLALSLLAVPVSSVNYALMARHGRFREVTVARISSVLVGLVSAGAFLILDQSPWVVVIQYVVSAWVYALILQLQSRTSLRLELTRNEAKQVLGFGGLVALNDTLVAIAANAGTIILGRTTTVAQAGIYSLAVFVTDTVRRTLMSVFNRVTFAHYSSIQDDNNALRVIYVKTVKWNCRIVFPIMVGICFFGTDFLVAALGPEWTQMRGVLVWLSVSVMFHVAGGSSSTVMKSIGRPGLDLALLLATTMALQLPGMIVGATLHGLLGVAIAAAVTKLVSVVVRQVVLDRLVGSTLSRVCVTAVAELFKSLPIVITWIVFLLVDWPPVAESLIGIAAACLVLAVSMAPRRIGSALLRPLKGKS